MREPSIHITKTDLIKIMKKMCIEQDVDIMVDEIFIKAKSKSLTTRSMVVSNALAQKKFDKLIKATNDDTYQFIKIMTLTRRTHKHKGVTVIKENSKDWTTCKEICQNALSFQEDFKLDKNQAFRIYVDIAMGLMNKFYLPKMTGMHQSICQYYESSLSYAEDETPDDTDKLYRYFQKHVLDKVGVPIDYKNSPEKFEHFIKAKRLADSMGMKYDIFIQAQFHAFEWRQSIPEPSQMWGDKARERCIKYAFENNLRVKSPNTKKINFKKIRDDNNKD